MKKRNPNKPVNNVRADYNRIAAQFASTRHYQWPEMAIFAKYIKDGWSVLDIGCGNGRLLSSLKDKNISYLGIDNSQELIKIARKNHPEKDFKIMNMEDLRLTNDSFDSAFSVASLQHLPTNTLRVQSLKEAMRVLKKDGYFFITVWDLWQPKYRRYIWENFFKMIFKGSKTHFGDTLIPWKDSNRNILAERYYFAYTKRGLSNDLEKAGFDILEVGHSRFNIYAIARKSDPKPQ